MGRYLCAVLLLVTFPAFAEDYAFAVSWQPEFCETKADKPECKTINSKRFDARNPSLHGLWPQHQEYCSVDPKDKEKDKQSRWNELPEVTLTPETKKLLDEVMPGTTSFLERHEWTRHGSCSGVSQEIYFKKAATLVKNLASTKFAALLRSKIGQDTTLEALLKIAALEFGANAKSGIEYLCVARKNSSQALTEIRFNLNANSVNEINLDRTVEKPIQPAKESDLCVGGPVYIDITPEADN